MSYQASPDDPPVAAIRHVKQRETDFDDLTRADHLVRDLLSDEIDVEEARVRLAQIASTGPPHATLGRDRSAGARSVPASRC